MRSTVLDVWQKLFLPRPVPSPYPLPLPPLSVRHSVLPTDMLSSSVLNSQFPFRFSISRKVGDFVRELHFVMGG